MPRSALHLILRRMVVALAASGAAQLIGDAAAAPPDQPVIPAIEVWAGAEAFRHVWSLYAGGAYAPFGSIREDGFRIRAVTGYGAYTYSSPRWTGAGTEMLQFHGRTTFADLLAGYHKQLGTLTVKVLGGLTVLDRDSDDPEAENGTSLGGKAVLETWWNITGRTWTSVDLSWTTLDDVYGAHARLGWRWWPALSTGIEGGTTGNRDYDTARLGVFLRYEWATGEAVVSGGLAGDGPGSGRVDLDGAFATINVLSRF